ncbi:heme oxygenase-like protein [Macrolepiota fuliginosa MF-IS2]|uniref:Heme oxygenase-like protein n=1 Tax=Macrolepiota fuliginosa MF-IS2 TaxID=1400762 RepID=A0A9P5X5E8_9AGAR|nr:heme oxygenase-like protein [Macrolepiota fuliginosa MF-IS2]
MSSLTDHLTKLATVPKYSEAINHPFLIAAGNGTLSPKLLALWLSQDRIYAAHAYSAFVGVLISNIPWNSSHGLDSPEEKMNQRILTTLIYSLTNVAREVNFFKETAVKWQLPLEGWKERKGTKNYTAEMARTSKNGLVDGLVFLWAMERVYLDAWSFVANKLKASGHDQNSALGSFSTNWSCPEFIEFVDDLAKLVDDLDIQPNSDTWKRAEVIWARVVELEVDFWPIEGEEVSHRASHN